MTSLEKLGANGLKVNILYAEAGNVTENDVLLASASKAIVIGFSVQADAAAMRLADAEGVSIRLYDVIYRLTDDVDKALKGLLPPEYKDVTIGKAEVRQVFRIPKVGNIAGCFVREGEIQRGAKARVWRGSQMMFEGDLTSLKREKDDAREVRQGFECGIGLSGFDAFKAGDVIEFYVRTLER